MIIIFLSIVSLLSLFFVFATIWAVTNYQKKKLIELFKNADIDFRTYLLIKKTLIEGREE